MTSRPPHIPHTMIELVGVIGPSDDGNDHNATLQRRLTVSKGCIASSAGLWVRFGRNRSHLFRSLSFSASSFFRPLSPILHSSRDCLIGQRHVIPAQPAVGSYGRGQGRKQKAKQQKTVHFSQSRAAIVGVRTEAMLARQLRARLLGSTRGTSALLSTPHALLECPRRAGDESQEIRLQILA